MSPANVNLVPTRDAVDRDKQTNKQTEDLLGRPPDALKPHSILLKSMKNIFKIVVNQQFFGSSSFLLNSK